MTVLVEVVHAVKPLTNTVFDKWVDWYGADVMPAMGRSGFDVIGAFKRSTGLMGEDVLLIRFESMTEYEKATGNKPEAFLGSSPGAWHAGTKVV